ncbi:hypothetical protein M0804_012119 [Polistes exclamans]|nr:hypothetical protein M0804_012119 [Polistes exclamans]
MIVSALIGDWRLEIIAIRMNLFIHGLQTELLGRSGDDVVGLDRMGFHHGWDQDNDRFYGITEMVGIMGHPHIPQSMEWR